MPEGTSQAGKTAVHVAQTHPGSFRTTIKRIFELVWLMLATAAALFLFQTAKETNEENEHLRSELRRQKKTLDNTEGKEGSGLCSICLIETVEVIIQPCGHVCVCRDCASVLMEKVEKKCPICRRTIQKIQNVYLS